MLSVGCNELDNKISFKCFRVFVFNLKICVLCHGWLKNPA